MASKQVPVTITYRKPGTSPPVFLSGTFSDPPWQPKEMSYVVDDDSNHIFQLKTSAPEGSKIEYKFRLGPGDWWVLDETAGTVADDLGNLNNVMTVPASPGGGNIDDDLDDLADEDTADPPMLPHESYKPDDIEEWPINLPTTDQEIFGTSRKGEDEIDTNDPRFEHFPSENRHSIIAALRKIEGSVSEDGTSIAEDSLSHGHPLSPQISPMTPDPSTSPKSQRRSFRPDLPSDHAMELPRSPRSLASLQSIEETMEEEPSDTIEDRISGNDPEVLQDRRISNVSPGSGNIQTIKGPVVTPLEPRESASSEDEGISMAPTRKENDTNALRHRGKAKTPTNSRSKTPSSVNSTHGASNNGNWLQTFLHVVFVDWVGGFFIRFWNQFLRGRKGQT
ncbi:Pt repeat family protein [Apiospora aurea]|uniref:Pt repeat family protein n=1 Tax=Apiospora aurea TaxID=335848 RepID=A0ABR1PVW6_9PEZI